MRPHIPIAKPVPIYAETVEWADDPESGSDSEIIRGLGVARQQQQTYRNCSYIVFIVVIIFGVAWGTYTLVRAK